MSEAKAAEPRSDASLQSASEIDEHRASKRPQPLVGFLRGAAAAALVAAIAAATLYGCFEGLKNAARSTEAPPLLEGVPLSTALYSREGVLLRLKPASDGIYRLQTDLKHIDRNLIKATIAYEDQNFYSHPGFDIGALFRAALGSYLGGVRSGASTITMQLARLRLHLKTDTPEGKLRQIWHAMRYEAHYSKEEILEAYLNLAPYGGNVEGAEAAAVVWFHRSAAVLDPSQAALLAVIPQNPVKRRPRATGNTALEAAKLRLIRILQTRGLYSADEALLMKAPTEVFEPSQLPFLAPHYAQTVLSSLVGIETRPRTGKLTGTLRIDLQEALESLTEETVARLRPWGIRNAAVSVVDARDRSVVALVGSAGFFNSAIEGEVNAWTSRRSPGSMLKPFTYALAADQGLIHEKTMLFDRPSSFGGWAPENADGDFRGPITAEDALVMSRNLPAVELERQLKFDLYDFLKLSGVPLAHEKNWYGLTLPLGGAEITMAEAQKLYAMLAGDGLLRPLRLLLDDPSPAEGEPISLEAQFLVKRMLESRGETISIRGRRETLYYKTGTSNGWRDAWTAGWVGPYVIVVWVGDFRGAPNPLLQGARVAAPLFKSAALRLASLQTDWPQAETPRQTAERLGLRVAEEPVCSATGDLDVSLCPDKTISWIIPGKTSLRPSGVFREIWLDRSSGLRACGPGPNTVRRVWEFWPSNYQEIFRAVGIVKPPPPPYTAQCRAALGLPGGKAPEIISPRPAATLRSIASDGSARTVLSAGADSDAKILYWYADGAFVGSAKVGESIVWAAPAGEHRITVTDDLGRSGAASFSVLRR